jgi:predicted nucleic acid-binding protein
VRASFVFPRDPADAMLIELAIDARATHIVSYDADLLSLPTSRGDAGKRFRQRLRGTSVVRPEELIHQYPRSSRRPERVSGNNEPTNGNTF